MEFKISALVENIEKLRNLLHNLIATNEKLTDKNIVDCSQELDKLITEYEKYKSITGSNDDAA